MQNGAIRYGKVFSHKPATMAWRLRLAPAWEVPRILLQPLSSNMMPRNGEQFISKWPHNSQDWSREVWNKCEYILTKLYAHTHTYTHVYIYIYTLILNLYLYIILISSYIISCSVRSCQHWEPGLKNGRAHEDDDALTLFGAWLLWPKVAASTRESTIIYPTNAGRSTQHIPRQCSYPIVSEAWQRRWVGRFQEGHHDSWKASCCVRMGNVWKCVFPLCTYFKMASKGCEFQSLALPESPNDE